MITLAICVGALALLFWIANTFERRLRISAKWTDRHRPKISLSSGEVQEVIHACDLLLEIHEGDPQGDDYRHALQAKFFFENLLKK